MGVPIQHGGSHETQGTHNRLIRLSDDQYLEVIAINPAGKKPSHPRWFDLDNPTLQSAIVDIPQLISWAVRVSDIKQVIQIPPYDQYIVHSLSRGDLHWQAALTPDGRLPEGGILPLAIQWQVDLIPPKRLPDRGCKINELTIRHPNSKLIESKLTAMGLATPISIYQEDQAQLIVDLQIPNGSVRLCSSMWPDVK